MLNNNGLAIGQQLLVGVDRSANLNHWAMQIGISPKGI